MKQLQNEQDDLNRHLEKLYNDFYPIGDEGNIYELNVLNIREKNIQFDDEIFCNESEAPSNSNE